MCVGFDEIMLFYFPFIEYILPFMLEGLIFLITWKYRSDLVLAEVMYHIAEYLTKDIGRSKLNLVICFSQKWALIFGI